MHRLHLFVRQHSNRIHGVLAVALIVVVAYDSALGERCIAVLALCVESV